MTALDPTAPQRSTRRGWSTLDYFLKARPEEYCDIAAPGEGMTDRTFMQRQAERIVRSPKLSREERATIERIWLAEAPALRALA